MIGTILLEECQWTVNLHHPHILPLYDSGDADVFLYYVMPYEEGQSLRDKLAHEGELPIREAVRILRDVVDALSHAHKHGVVHREIKPDNVMLSERHALVTDFGVAKAVSEATGAQRLTIEGVALGTPAKMSPEQAADAAGSAGGPVQEPGPATRLQAWGSLGCVAAADYRSVNRCTAEV